MMFGMKYPKCYYDVRSRGSFSVRPWRVRPSVAPWIPKPWTDGQALLCPDKRYLPSEYEAALHNARHHDGHLYSDKQRRLPPVISKDTPSIKDLHAEDHLSARTFSDSSKSSALSLTGSVCSANHIASSAVCRKESDGARLGRRMNTNGIDRSAMTGSSTTTSENISWNIATQEPAIPCQSQGTRPAPSAIITSPPGGDPQALMHLQGPGSIFRPPLTDPSRLYPGPGQYAPIFTTTGTTLPPYSPTPLYSPGQTSPLAPIAPYGHFYPQFSPSPGGGYPPGSLLPSASSPYAVHAGRVQSYSEVLARLGSEHGQALPHYSPSLLPHHQYPGALTPTNSPGPGSGLRRVPTPSQNPLTPTAPGPHHHHLADPSRKSPKLEQKDPSRGPGALVSPPRGEVKSGHSPLSHYKHPQHPGVKDSPAHEGKDSSGFKYPSGSGSKDSPRKPKYHSRPPDLPAEALAYGDSKHHGQFKQEEPAAKRHRPSEGAIGNPPPLHTVHQSSIPHTSASGSGGGASLPPPPPLHPSYPSQPHYPPHFMKGSVIQLANGELKRVEDLRTEDFVNSADISADLKIDSSTVVRIEQSVERGTAILGFSVGEQRIQVTVEATLEHPFFVFGQGWSSCSPERTSQRYGLQCHKLSVGDVCISLTQKETNSQAAATTSTAAKSSSQHGVAAAERANQISDSGTLAASAVSSQSGNTRVQRQGQTTSAALTEGGQATLHSSGSSRPTQEPPLTPMGTGVSPSTMSQPRKRRWSAPDQLSAESESPGGQSHQQEAASTPVKADENGDSKTKSTRDDNQGQNT